MDEKRSFRSKRAKTFEESTWDCSVCTYKNPSEAFKCEMCDVRKGTSTRKPRLNQQMVAQQAAQQFPQPAAPPPPKKEKPETPTTPSQPQSNGLSDGESPPKDNLQPNKDKKLKRKSSRPPRLRNIDRSSGTSMAVTVDNVTVIITDYKPKKKELMDTDPPSPQSSSQPQNGSSPRVKQELASPPKTVKAEEPPLT